MNRFFYLILVSLFAHSQMSQAAQTIDVIMPKLEKMGIVRFYCSTQPDAVTREIFASSQKEAIKLFLLKVNARFYSADLLVTTDSGKEVPVTDFSCR